MINLNINPFENSSGAVVNIDSVGGNDLFVTPFNQLLIAEETPLIQIHFVYGIFSDLTLTNIGNGGTVTSLQSIANISSSISTNGFANIYSKKIIHYRSGQSSIVRLSALFTQGVTGSRQEIGLSNGSDSLLFGYNDTVFGIKIIRNGVETFIPQSSWNKDKLDGTGKSEISLDPTKGNIYLITFQWLGFGTLCFYIYSPTGNLILVHQVQYANDNTVVSLVNPSFKLYAGISKISGNSDIVLKISCMAASSAGRSTLATYHFRYDDNIGIAADIIEKPIYVLQNKTTFSGIDNFSTVRLHSASLAATLKRITFRFYKGYVHNTTGGTFIDVDTINSCTTVNKTPATLTTKTGLTQIFSTTIETDTSILIELERIMADARDIAPNEYLIITAIANGSNTYASVSLGWLELR